MKPKESKPRGGARPGSGRKPKYIPVQPVAAVPIPRTVTKLSRAEKRDLKKAAADWSGEHGLSALLDIVDRARQTGNLPVEFAAIKEIQARGVGVPGQEPPAPSFDLGEMIRRMAEKGHEDASTTPVEPRTWTVELDPDPPGPKPAWAQEIQQKFLPPAPPEPAVDPRPSVELDDTALVEVLRVPVDERPILHLEVDPNASERALAQLERDRQAWAEDGQVTRVLERGPDGALRERE